jgi:hypothetical protein
MTVGQRSGTQVVPCCEETPRHESMYMDGNSSLPGEMMVRVFTYVTPCEKKVHLSLSTPWSNIGGKEVYLHSFFISTLERGEWSNPRPQPLYLEKETRYQLNKSLGGPQNRAGRCGEEDIS